MEDENTVLVGILTGRSYGLLHEAMCAGLLPQLKGYPQVRPKSSLRQVSVWISIVRSRLRARLLSGSKQRHGGGEQGGVVLFPDAVSERASRYLRELMVKVQHGQRAMLCFRVQRDDVRDVRRPMPIDRVYGQTLREALQLGVKVSAYAARITTEELE